MTELEKLVTKMEEAGQEWVRLKLQSDQLEEDKKSFLSALKLISGESADAKQETAALAMKQYREYISNMVTASNATLRAKVRYDNLVRYFEIQRSQYVTERDLAKTLGAKF